MKKYLLALLVCLLPALAVTGERETRSFFKEVRDEPTLLRNFLYC